ncbi:MAG: NAD-dependent epimerase/dehydratase family protein [Nitrosarchaeum sp.]
MNFLVTGGAGFIGSRVVKLLLEEKHTVGVIDNLHSGKLKNLADCQNKIDFHNLDIQDIEKIKSTVSKSDGIFHFAALTDVLESFTKQTEYHAVNVKGTQKILDIAKQFDLKVVFASSAAVYGDTKQIPIKEDAKRSPLNPYGQTKLDGEYLCEKYSQMGTKINVLRFFNVYGKGQNPAYAGVISKFLENVSTGKPPIIYGDGTQTRDFVYVDDVAKANLLAMNSNSSGKFINIGTGIKTSVRELAEMIIKISKQNITPIYVDAKDGDIRDSQADITLAHELLKWNPKTKIDDWLKTLQNN